MECQDPDGVAKILPYRKANGQTMIAEEIKPYSPSPGWGRPIIACRLDGCSDAVSDPSLSCVDRPESKRTVGGITT